MGEERVVKNRGWKEQFIILFFGFILSSLTGWLYETIITWIVNGVYCDRGILHLPICPIYGFGSCILLCVLHRVKKPLFIFAGGTLLTGTFEYFPDWQYGVWTPDCILYEMPSSFIRVDV